MTFDLSTCPQCNDFGDSLTKEISEIFTMKAIQIPGGPRYRSQAELSDVPSLSTRKERAYDYELYVGNDKYTVKKASYTSYCPKCNMVF